MSRSKYVSVGGTGGLILDSKYDDFATNAAVAELRDKIVEVRDEIRGASVAGTRLSPKTNLFVEHLPERSILSIATSYVEGQVSYGIDHGWVSVSDDGWESKTNGARSSTEYGAITRFCVWSDGTFVALTNQGNIIRFDDIDLSNLRETLNTDGRVSSSINISFWEDGVNRIVLLGDYQQGTSYPPKLYMSLDGGETFNVILEGKALSGNNHWHATCYDRFSGTIWASQGDGGSATTYFSTDLGSTWTEVSLKEGKHSSYAQPTLILPFPSRMVFGRDGAGIPPGIDEWVRDGKNITPSNVFLPEPALTFKNTYGSHMYYPSLSYTAVLPLNPLVAYVSFPYQSSDKQEISFIFATGDGGESWHSVYAGLKKMWVKGTDGVNLFCTGIQGAGSIYRAKLVEWV